MMVPSRILKLQTQPRTEDGESCCCSFPTRVLALFCRIVKIVRLATFLLSRSATTSSHRRKNKLAFPAHCGVTRAS